MLAIQTLKDRSDFLRLRRGKKTMTPYFILRSGPAMGAGERAHVGYTVTTKCGNAVVRNRIKRRLRALVRELFPECAKPGMEYNFIALAEAKPSAAEAPFEQLREAMRAALQSAAR